MRLEAERRSRDFQRFEAEFENLLLTSVPEANRNWERQWKQYHFEQWLKRQPGPGNREEGRGARGFGGSGRQQSFGTMAGSRSETQQRPVAPTVFQQPAPQPVQALQPIPSTSAASTAPPPPALNEWEFFFIPTATCALPAPPRVEQKKPPPAPRVETIVQMEDAPLQTCLLSRAPPRLQGLAEEGYQLLSRPDYQLVLPTEKELLDPRLLYKDLENKSTWSDPDSYIEVQKRLLRAECLLPLLKYLKTQRERRGEGGRMNPDNVTVYRQVELEGIQLTPRQVTYCLSFVPDSKTVSWDVGLNLKYGNLLCLFCPDALIGAQGNWLDCYYWAIVTGAHPAHLERGIVFVSFIGDSFKRWESCVRTVKKEIKMVESPSFIVAHEPVLRCLEHFSQRCPGPDLLNALIRGEHPTLPRYLQAYLEKEDPVGLEAAGNSPTALANLVASKIVDPLFHRPLRLPRGVAHFDADPNQIRALQHVFSCNLAIIQGPPGTGKTLLGSMIIHRICEIVFGFKQDDTFRTELETLSEKVALNRQALIEQRNVVERLTAEQMKDLSSRRLNCELVAEHSKLAARQREVNESILKLSALLLQRDAKQTEDQKEGPRPPIVVLAYKNHSLDELLSRCLDFELSIVRIGTRSGNYDLLPYNLNQKILATKLVRKVRPGDTPARNAEEELAKVRTKIAELTRVFRPDHAITLPIFLACATKQQVASVLGDSALEIITKISTNATLAKVEKDLDALNVQAVTRREWENRVQRLFESVDTTELDGDPDGDSSWLAREFEREFATERQFSADTWKAEEPILDRIYRRVRRKIAESRLVHEAGNSVFDDGLLEANSSGISEDLEEIERLASLRDSSTQHLKDRMNFRPEMWVPVDQRSVPDPKDLGDVDLASCGDKLKEIALSWLANIRSRHVKRVLALLPNYQQTCEHYSVELDTLRLQVLRDARIIGMTTTGMAMNAHLIERLKPEVVVIEEAAELLEGQFIACLPSSVQHVVMLGDHRQLRPLCREELLQCNLHISPFERLITSRSQSSGVMLTTQHRMHPNISKLINHFYRDELKDSPETSRRTLKQWVNGEYVDHPVVGGLVPRVNWLCTASCSKEKKSSLTPSIYNENEATIVANFVRFLNGLCGVAKDDIAVLTMYKSQIGAIRRALLALDIPIERSEEKDPIRVTTCDAFQGCESSVVVLSLVRTEPVDKGSFINLDNRICVALSRARHALYIFGSSQAVAGCQRWKYVLDAIQHSNKVDFVGNWIDLTCVVPDHHDRDKRRWMLQRNQLDFPTRRTELRCPVRVKCETKLACGHSCPIDWCHCETDHDGLQCAESKMQCERVCDGCQERCPIIGCAAEHGKSSAHPHCRVCEQLLWEK
eukprot:TRINITY_DN16585_c0_g1_i4.p1 TRINITY_DN16585_c0_g1~~TRINITY_DN16585_c0_g1_i4.p1  ORF type:complete len:1452 (-),score=163.31 TRINITY_DN16585_c0_g1_i4:40-4143(-)